MFGEPLDVAQPGIDFVTASANKCLQGIAGVSFVIARRAAVEALAGAAPRSVYLDLHGHYASQEQDNTPFTPAVQVLHAMEQAIAELDAETLKRRIERYAENARVLREGMTRLGLEILVPGGCALEHPHDVPAPGRRHVRRAPRRDEAAGLHHLRRPGRR